MRDNRDERIEKLREAIKNMIVTLAEEGFDLASCELEGAIEDDDIAARNSATAQSELDRLVHAGSDKARLDFVTKAVHGTARSSFLEAWVMSANFLDMIDALRAWEAAQTTESAADLTDITTERAALAGGRDEVPS